MLYILSCVRRNKRNWLVSNISQRLRHYHIVTYIVTSSLETTRFYFQTNSRNRRHYIRYLVEQTEIFLRTVAYSRSRDSAVGIVTGYGMDDRRVRVRVLVRSRIFSSSRRPDLLRGPHNLISNGYRGALSPGVKRPGSEADHSPPASAEVKENVDLYIYSPIRLHGVVLNSLSTGTTLPFTLHFICMTIASPQIPFLRAFRWVESHTDRSWLLKKSKMWLKNRS
jgi:hypothetical protein